MQQPLRVELRKATPADAPFLALALMEALGGEVMQRQQEGTLTPSQEKTLQVLVTLCLRSDTLYTWRYGTLATLPDGTPAAASIAYPGSEYRERRNISFSLARSIITFDTEAMQDEAQPGELYLDTLATLPHLRNKGIARILMQQWLDDACDASLRPTLIVASDNLKAQRLYESMGLRDAGPIFVFGDTYRKMAMP